MDFTDWLKNFTNVKILYDQPMRKYTGYKVGGNAKYFIYVNSLKDFRDTISVLKAQKIDYKIIGRGTNLVFCDLGFNGAVISTANLKSITQNQEKLTCLSGNTLKSIIDYLVDKGIYALCPLYGIPASLGGALMMNAGAFNLNISNYVSSVDLLKNDKKLTLNNEECGFRYRGSKLLDDGEIILSATFDLEKMKNGNSHLDLKHYCQARKKLQPTGFSCGSVFKNPPDDFAGRLIDLANLKGKRIGGASVSNKHGNFIITNNNATALDVYKLTKFIQEKVKEKFNITLENEIEFVGEF